MGAWWLKGGISRAFVAPVARVGRGIGISRMGRRAGWRAAHRVVGSAVALLACSCANLRDGQHQVIYVPTENGVQAQRVSVGPPPSNDGHPEESTAVDRETEWDDVRAALLSNSDSLEYLGQVSEPLFILESQLEASFVPRRNLDYDSGNSICPLWARHVRQLLGAGELESCQDYQFKAERFRSGRWQTAEPTFHALSYAFERLRERCGDVGGWPLPCEGPPFRHPAISTLPVCAVVVAQLFRSTEGRQFALIEGTDPRVYGGLKRIGDLSDPDRSKQIFSRDFSYLNTREACANFFGDEAL
jgi:hypothetical protein